MQIQGVFSCCAERGGGLAYKYGRKRSSILGTMKVPARQPPYAVAVATAQRVV